MVDLGLICTVMGSTGPTGATGPQGIQGEVGLKAIHDKYAHFCQTTLLRFESDIKLSVNTVKLGDNYASSVEFSNVNLMIKRILYDL